MRDAERFFKLGMMCSTGQSMPLAWCRRINGSTLQARLGRAFDIQGWGRDMAASRVEGSVNYVEAVDRRTDGTTLTICF
jgi:hypothetical protein